MINNWISVKDKLPEDDEYVLIYHNGSKAIKISWYSSFNEKWMMDYNNIHITHWQPLPEPPKELEGKIKV